MSSVLEEDNKMKQRYIDKFGNDSLTHLKIASENATDIFVTTNQGVLEDREELEKHFKIKIRTPIEIYKEKLKQESKKIKKHKTK